jgi:hypothetical protein
MTSTALIGIAGVHHVVSELSRRGMVALPTVRNTAAYDIVAMNVEGTKHANIQVKTSSKRVRGFPMPPPDKIRTGRRDYYVFARWIEADGKYECFLLTGRQTKAAVQSLDALEQVAIDAGTRTVLFHALSVGGNDSPEGRRWRTAWLTWKL